MNISLGIVGLPNVGKSTLFNALTKSKIAAAANYPFCTIDPNNAPVSVPDKRLEALASIVHPDKIVPSIVEFVDIAGLVEGASNGEGLGNQFLSHIRECSAICHVVRVFDDESIIHVNNSIHPERDLEVIMIELQLADIESLNRQKERIIKKVKAGDSESKIELEVMDYCLEQLEKGINPDKNTLTDEQQKKLHMMHLLSTKPYIIIANVSEDMLIKGVKPVFEKYKNITIIPVCARLEAELSDMDSDESSEYLSSLGIQSSGRDELISAAFDLLSLQSYFTAGVQEVRAWTIRKGDTAPQAAGVIHTDFEAGFIRAEVIAYDDYIQCNGELGAKNAGKLRAEGKEYRVKDGDVIHFLFKK